MKIKFLFLYMAFLCNAVAMAQTDDVRHEVLLETSLGDIRLALYNETPAHRDNFLKLVREGYYDGNLFHRVIVNFMIQSGDSTSRHAVRGEQLGEYSPDYTIPAEIHYPQLFHKRGALAAARESDEDNPQRASSASQFYIVYGHKFGKKGLEKAQDRLDKQTGGQIKLTSEVKDVYSKMGGTPHLDGQYTVFGEVVEGMDIVEAIQGQKTDENDRPLEDVEILKATVLK